jgi:alpha-N-arabinofuranosidase
LSHYPQWDLEVLQECYETVDYISLHHYHIAAPGDYAALMGGSCFFEDYINTEIALCDFVQTKLRTPKQMMLSFDEYGSRMQPLGEILPGRGKVWEHSFDPEREYVRHDPNNMVVKQRHPQGGDILAALTSASTLLTLLRHADRVKIGCMTRGLTALVESDRDHVWKSASYYPYTQLMRYGQGTSLRVSVDCETYDIPGYAINHQFQYRTHEGIGFVDSAAAHNEENGELNVFVINRDWESDTSVELDVGSFEGYKFVEHIQLYSDDIDAVNSYDNPNVVVPSINSAAVFKDGKISANLKKLSWNVFRLTKQK